MRIALATLAVLVSFAALVPAQERSAPKKAPPAFPEAIDAAKKAVDAEKFGAAIAALQAAIRDLQKKQRVQVLAALPKPDGWQVEDPAPDEQGADLAGLLGGGFAVHRHYRNGDKSIDVEITANAPLIAQMMGIMFSNPAMIEADGGELVKYGAHKAILKKAGDNGQELSILMHDLHLVKATSQGLKADELLKVFDQACVDRLEKPLGK